MSGHPDPERLSAYLDRELAVAEAARVESHLGGCAGCSAHLADLAAVDAHARAAEVRVPEGYFEAFPARVRARLQERRVRAVSPRGWAFLAAAAAVLLAVPLALRMRELPAPEAAPPAATASRDLPGKLSARPEDAMAQAPAGTAAVPEAAGGRAAADEAAARRNEPASRDARSADARRDARLQKRFGQEGTLEQQERDAAARAVPATPAAGPPPPPAVAPEKLSADKAAAAPAQASAGARREAAAPRDSAALRAADATASPEAKERDEGNTPAPTAARSRPRPLAGAADAPAVAAPKAEGSEAEGFAEELPDAPADTVRTRFAALAGRDAETVEEARALRDAWRAFARAHPDGPLAEEARVREIEAGALAWRLGGESADRQRARADAEAYLRREDAHGRERVRAALERLRREEK